MRLPRFRLRTLMMAAAVVAVGSTVAILWTKQISYLKQAERFLAYQPQDQTLIDGYRNSWRREGERAKSNDESVREGQSQEYWREQAITSEMKMMYYSRQLDYHLRMARMYIRAAAYPWKPAPPGPTTPSEPKREETSVWLLWEEKKKSARQTATPVIPASSPARAADRES